MTDYERGWRDGVKAARDYLRWIWDDGPQGNANDAAELTLLDTYGEKGPPSEPSPGGAPKCHCTYEAGDSPCPMHGMEEPEPPPPGPKPPKIRNLTRPASPSTETRAEGERCGRCGGEGWHWDADIRSGKAKCFDCGGTGTRRGSNG